MDLPRRKKQPIPIDLPEGESQPEHVPQRRIRAGNSLADVCRKGPFEKKEQLWEELKRFQEYQHKLRSERRRIYAMDDAADYFGMEEEELTRQLTSPGFTNYCVAIDTLKARMDTLHLDGLAIEKLMKMGKATNVACPSCGATGKKGTGDCGTCQGTGTIPDIKASQQFMQELNRRREALGFTDVRVEDIDDLRRDEGPKLIADLASALQTLNGGKLVPIQRVLPMVLGLSNSASKGDGLTLEAHRGNNPADEAVVPSGPDTTMGSARRPETDDGIGKETGDSGSGEQVGENGGDVGGCGPFPDGEAPLP